MLARPQLAHRARERRSPGPCAVGGDHQLDRTFPRALHQVGQRRVDRAVGEVHRIVDENEGTVAELPDVGRRQLLEETSGLIGTCRDARPRQLGQVAVDVRRGYEEVRRATCETSRRRE